MSDRQITDNSRQTASEGRSKLGSILGCLPMGCLTVAGLMFICVAPVIGMAAMGWLDWLK